MSLSGKTKCQKTLILDLNSFKTLKRVTWPLSFFVCLLVFSLFVCFFFPLVSLRNGAERSLGGPLFQSFAM